MFEICFFIRVPALWFCSLWNILRLSGEHIQFACAILAALVGYGWLLVPVWHCWVRLEAKWCCHFWCWKRCTLLSECHGRLPDSLISDPFAGFSTMAPHQNFQQLGNLASLFIYPTRAILSLDVMRSWLHVSTQFNFYAGASNILRCSMLNHRTLMSPPVLLSKQVKVTTVPSILRAGVLVVLRQARAVYWLCGVWTCKFDLSNGLQTPERDYSFILHLVHLAVVLSEPPWCHHHGDLCGDLPQHGSRDWCWNQCCYGQGGCHGGRLDV